MLATGAAVRLVAPLLGAKQTDPAVLAVDETGQHVVALLGGHQSGANALAQAVADAIGAEPVISTASDALGLPALDQLGKAEEWRIEATPETLKRALRGGRLRCRPGDLPGGGQRASTARSAARLAARRQP